MNHFVQYCRGYVRVRLSSNMPERFLNLCGANRIDLWNLQHVDDGYQITMSIRDFRRLQPLCRKTGSRLHIIEKHGMPFFFYKNRKRKGFFFGFLLFAACLYLLSCFIWNIHIEGNHANSTYSILLFLEQQGIHHGIRKDKLECQEISAQVRQAFPNITWVSTKIQGTQLVVEVKENVDGYQEEEEPSVSEPNLTDCDLVAKKDGTILRIITRSGIPLVKEGDDCKEGDILVSGAIPIVNDSGETIRMEYVHADSDIEMLTSHYYYREFERSYVYREYMEEKDTLPFVEIAGYRLDFADFIAEPKMAVSFEKTRQLFLTENFALPIYWGSTVRQTYKEETRTYTEEECMEIANRQMQQCMEELEKMGVQISENNVRIEINDSSCIAKGEFLVIEHAYKEVPCDVSEPGKDNELDEQ